MLFRLLAPPTKTSDVISSLRSPFQLATKVTTFFIEHFGMRDLFGRENYEYYARLTGRILKVGRESGWVMCPLQVPITTLFAG